MQRLTLSVSHTLPAEYTCPFKGTGGTVMGLLQIGNPHPHPNPPLEGEGSLVPSEAGHPPR